MKLSLKFIFLTILFIPILTLSQTNKNYIAITYSSICCGTPSEKPVMDFVKKAEKKLKLKPFEIFIENGLGKEGEHSFYIGTDNLINNQLKSFWNNLKHIASNQNQSRSKNENGFVNIEDNLISNSTLKSIKANPRTSISSLKIYNYKE
ncbi:hypothetical protein [Flavobacterium sp. MMS24-S5]|uniref:hypothetical protein n=1 Tax=Flavobacterium sp. MMS24-S5 TaxID=3416605 RepID=UPI003D018621